MEKFITQSPKETERLGEKIGKRISQIRLKNQAQIIALEGDLGGGKTTFLKGLAKGMGIKERILSPTFLLIRKFQNFYHIDCYRIKKPSEILKLGFRKIVKDPQNIVAIEWAERIKGILPRKILKIKFKILGKKKREILIKWQRDC
jgi:tRNA threonylcarbamoyladenosine biosynthesis protein TsaE